jgi:hypothetical protein
VLDALLAEARGDDNVVGIVVFGSRGKGAFVTEASDWASSTAGSLTCHGCVAMRRALPLLLGALVVAGCGASGTTYTAKQVRAVFGPLVMHAQAFSIVPAPQTAFASLAAVTALRIEEGRASPTAVLGGEAFELLLYRTRHEASLGQQFFLSEVAGVRVERRGNVVFLPFRSATAAIAAFARLH